MLETIFCFVENLNEKMDLYTNFCSKKAYIISCNGVLFGI